MKILITGGAGFVGSHLADRLLARGDEVLVIDNFATGRRDNLVPNPGLRLVEGTIADSALFGKLCDEFKPDMLVHAAAAYRDPDNWIEDSITNVQGSAVVFQHAKRVGVKRIIYFQTALCYGLKPLEQPITLRHPILPDGSSYAISKSAAEYYLHLSGVDAVTFRLANAYGPRNISGPLPTFYSRLTTGKPCFVMDTRRDFIYIDDLIDVVVKALDGKGRAGAYHISSGADFAIKQLFDATVKALGINLDKPVEVRPRGPDDVFTILLDPSETNRDFAWATSTSLELGVKRAIEYYKAFGITQTYTHLRMEDKKK